MCAYMLVVLFYQCALVLACLMLIHQAAPPGMAAFIYPPQIPPKQEFHWVVIVVVFSNPDKYSFSSLMDVEIVKYVIHGFKVGRIEIMLARRSARKAIQDLNFQKFGIAGDNPYQE